MGSVVSVWDVDTGEKIIQFSNVQGGGEITAMCFDPSGRRLITGGRNGKLNIWNFNNGACLSQLNLHDTSEVLWLKIILIHNPLYIYVYSLYITKSDISKHMFNSKRSANNAFID